MRSEDGGMVVVADDNVYSPVEWPLTSAMPIRVTYQFLDLHLLSNDVVVVLLLHDPPLKLHCLLYIPTGSQLSRGLKYASKQGHYHLGLSQPLSEWFARCTILQTRTIHYQKHSE